MNKSRIYLALLIILIISFGYYVLSIAGVFKRGGGERKNVYRNKEDGYAFILPEGFEVDEYPSGDLAINEKGEDITALELKIFEKNDSRLPFAEFAEERARQLCAADGPNMSISCTDVEERESFQAKTELSGEILYFKEETRNIKTGETIRSKKGPFFIFDISSGAGTKLLIMHPPIATPVGEVDSVIMRVVAETIDIIE